MPGWCHIILSVDINLPLQSHSVRIIINIDWMLIRQYDNDNDNHNNNDNDNDNHNNNDNDNEAE